MPAQCPMPVAGEENTVCGTIKFFLKSTELPFFSAIKVTTFVGLLTSVTYVTHIRVLVYGGGGNRLFLGRCT